MYVYHCTQTPRHEIRRNVYIEDWWKLVDFERVDLMAAHMKTLGHDEL